MVMTNNASNTTGIGSVHAHAGATLRHIVCTPSKHHQPIASPPCSMLLQACMSSLGALPHPSRWAPCEINSSLPKYHSDYWAGTLACFLVGETDRSMGVRFLCDVFISARHRGCVSVHAGARKRERSAGNHLPSIWWRFFCSLCMVTGLVTTSSPTLSPTWPGTMQLRSPRSGSLVTSTPSLPPASLRIYELCG